jgi:hypothetical protein
VRDRRDRVRGLHALAAALLAYGGPVLGPCRWWARYGAPGRGIAAWLPDGGHLLAESAPSVADAPVSRRSLFGRRVTEGEAAIDLGAESCLTGDSARCVSAMLEEGQWTMSRFIARVEDGPAIYARAPWGLDHGAIEHWFADLEAELGTDEFARVWRSDEPLEASLDRALDAGAAGWIVDWAQSRYGVEPRGPRLDATDLTLTLLTLALMLTISIGVARRRRIG